MKYKNKTPESIIHNPEVTGSNPVFATVKKAFK